jgi:hypothetical protein
VKCGYKRVYRPSEGDDIGECYREQVHDIEHQAQQAGWILRRAICRASISEGCYGVKTESLDILNEILEVTGYKIVEKK